MCGRFSQAYTWEQVHAFSGALGAEPRVGNLRPRYNVAPTTDVHIIVAGGRGRELRMARWGIVPFWWKKPLKGMPATFNARVETVETTPMYREAWKRRRCIIPASGFFERTGDKKDRIPHYFSAADGALLAFAGLWERWKNPDGEEVISCTIIVRDADELLNRGRKGGGDIAPVDLTARPTSWVSKAGAEFAFGSCSQAARHGQRCRDRIGRRRLGEAVYARAPHLQGRHRAIEMPESAISGTVALDQLSAGQLPGLEGRQALDLHIAQLRGHSEVDGAAFALSFAAGWLAQAASETGEEMEQARAQVIEQLRLGKRELGRVRG